MSDEERKDEERSKEGAGENGAPEAPPPRTAAGRARSGEPENPEPDATPEAEETPEAEDEAGAKAEPEAEDEAEAKEEPEAGEKPAEEKPAEASGQETVEVDTLAISDREAEQEAAHAGLRARAEKTAAQRVVSTGAQAAVAGAVTKLPEAGAGDPPKRTTWWRFIAASFVIVASTAAATSIAFLLYLTDIGDALGDPKFEAAVAPSLSEVEGDAPQTILILGSDKRSGTGEEHGRSDTTMLLRVDPDKEFLALLSLPRDLGVTIPGYGPDRLNAAYSFGGPELTARTVKDLLGIDINHVVNIDFEGFYDAINAIGCVYIDVDRHYYNPVGGEYDDIDIQAGYTKLCGYRALDYVRYRHNDNDLVRGARQQAFVREARQQIPPKDLVPFLPGSHGDELIDIFTKYTTSDIDDAPTIIEMLKSFADVRNAPVRQVSLGELTGTGTGVGASKEDVEVAVDKFLGNDLDEVPVEPVEPAPDDKKDKEKKESQEPAAPAMIDVTDTAEEYAHDFQGFLKRRQADLSVYYPTAVIANVNAGISEESRAHIVNQPDGEKKEYWGYKFVLPYQESFGTSYYGVSGVNWDDPPILNNPSEVRRIDGRDYLLFYEQEKLRLVGWQTDQGSYWVINTLTRALSEDQMLAVAESVREYRD